MYLPENGWLGSDPLQLNLDWVLNPELLSPDFDINMMVWDMCDLCPVGKNEVCLSEQRDIWDVVGWKTNQIWFQG